jgi:hypothetical protein
MVRMFPRTQALVLDPRKVPKGVAAERNHRDGLAVNSAVIRRWTTLRTRSTTTEHSISVGRLDGTNLCCFSRAERCCPVM